MSSAYFTQGRSRTAQCQRAFWRPLLLALSVFAAGCTASTPRNASTSCDSDGGWTTLRVGMSIGEVHAVLGEPSKTLATEIGAVSITDFYGAQDYVNYLSLGNPPTVRGWVRGGRKFGFEE